MTEELEKANSQALLKNLLNDTQFRNEIHHILGEYTSGSNTSELPEKISLLSSMNSILDSTVRVVGESQSEGINIDFGRFVEERLDDSLSNYVHQKLDVFTTQKQKPLTDDEIQQSVAEGKSEIKQYLKTLDRFMSLRVSDYYDLDNLRAVRRGSVPDNLKNIKFRKRVYDTSKLKTLIELSPILDQCITAMIDNVVGNGFNVIEKKQDTEEVQNKTEIELEKQYIDSVLERLNTDESLLETLEKLYRDYQDFGEFFVKVRHIEVSKDEMILAEARHVPANELVILKDVISADTSKEIKRGKNTLNFNVEKDYKIYAHLKPVYKQESKKRSKASSNLDETALDIRYYSEFGCPYKVDEALGLPVLEESEEASYQIYHYRDYDSTTSYGKPNWISKLSPIISQIEAQALNLEFFSTSLIPNILVLLNDITANNSDIAHFQRSMMRKLPNEQRQNNKVVFLKSLSNGILSKLKQSLEGETASSSRVGSIEILKLNDAERRELLFGDSDKRWENIIRSSFKLPPILVGMTDDYNRATSQASLDMAEEQVFSSERKYLEDFIESILFGKALGYGLKHHKIKLNISSVADRLEEAEFLYKVNQATGCVTPRMGLDTINKYTYNDYEQSKHMSEKYYDTPYDSRIKEANSTTIE